MGLKQQVTAGVVSQFGQPRGIGGRAAAWVMTHRSSNRQRNQWVVETLAPAPTDNVLEIGFGPGLAIEQLSRRVPDGRVCGIDRSELMLRLASRRNRAAIEDGRVELRVAAVEQVPDFGLRYDIVLTVNSLLFWNEPADRLLALRSLLLPGGRIAVAHQPRGPGAAEQEPGGELVQLLQQSGYEEVDVKTLALRPPVVGVIGRAT